MRLLAAPISAGSAGRIRFLLPRLWGCRRAVGNGRGLAAVPGMPSGDLDNRRHDIRRDPQAAAELVPVIWFVTSQQNGMSALGLQRALGPRQLRDLLDLAAQAAAGHGAARPRPPCRRDRGRRNLCGRVPGRRQAGPCRSRVRPSSRWRLNSAGAASGASAFGASQDVSAESLLAFLQEAVEPERQFTPTAGEATPGCRPPAIAIRSR